MRQVPIQKEPKIYVCHDIIENEEAWLTGEFRDVLCNFTFYQTQTDKEYRKTKLYNYAKCLELARRRANDGRYKNYEFFIDTME